VTQAAVESPGPVRVVDLFVERGSETNTGIAISNLSETGTLLVRLTLKDGSGNERATKDITIVARGHLALFISDLFPEVTTILGTLTLNAAGAFSVVTLQQTGLILGTLPPLTRPL